MIIAAGMPTAPAWPLERGERDTHTSTCILRVVQVTHELDFCSQAHDLVPNGADIPVTGANRQEFVDAYAQFLLVERVAVQFDAFFRGFRRVVDSTVLDMFIAPELEQVVCGVQDVDFQELRRGAHYDGGYVRDSQVVEWFWEVRLCSPNCDCAVCRRAAALCAAGVSGAETQGITCVHAMLTGHLLWPHTAVLNCSCQLNTSCVL